MKELTGTELAPLPKSAHLLEPVLRRYREEPDRPMVAVREGDRFVDLTVAECYHRVRRLAKGLVAAGVEPGDRVALMSQTRLEWILTDYAIMSVGGVTVPIYETSSAEQVHWVVQDSGAVLAVMETQAMHDLLREGGDLPPACREVLIIAEGGLDQLGDRGTEVDDATVDGRIAALTTDNLASIVYTSGTTGRSKGCELTHGNLRTNVKQSLLAVDDMLQPGDVSLLFLPLAHVLAKIITLVGIESGVKGAIGTGIPQLPEELKMVQPTMIVAVPRVFEKVYNTARHTAAARNKERIFDRAVDVAIKWSKAQENGGAGLGVRVEHAIYSRLVHSKIAAAFGGRMRFAVSGGGPLGERLTHFFRGVGVQIFEGYGLTETSPTLTINTADAWEPGTVGRPVPGTTIAIAEDGEILAKGPQVFRGYWNNDEATDEVKDADGWFHTGDVGAADSAGFVRITGRKKEILVTAAGKNVAPAPLEDRLRAHPLVSQAVVVGDGQPFIAALISLDEEGVQEWAEDNDLPDVPFDQLHSHEVIRAALQEAVDDANKSVSKAESIRKFAVLPRDLSIEEGELTPTLKVRRQVVSKTYASVIDELYG